MVNQIISNSALITMAALTSAFMSYVLNIIWNKFKGFKAVIGTILITLISFIIVLLGLSIASNALFS